MFEKIKENITHRGPAAVSALGLGSAIAQTTFHGATLPWQVVAGVVAGAVVSIFTMFVGIHFGKNSEGERRNIAIVATVGGALGVIASFAQHQMKVNPAFVWFSIGLNIVSLLFRVISTHL
jgi:hypothetical protein